MYFSVKNISKKLDDYDHIKLITEQDPLQVNFDEKPTYRKLIGKLLINQQAVESSNDSNEIDEDEDEKQHQQKSKNNDHLKLNRRSKHNETLLQQQHQARQASTSSKQQQQQQQTDGLCTKDMSRSLSLNDLIDDANYTTPAKNQSGQVAKHGSTATRKESDAEPKAKAVYTMLSAVKNNNTNGRTNAAPPCHQTTAAQSSCQNFSKLESNMASSSGVGSHLKTPFFKHQQQQQHQVVTVSKQAQPSHHHHSHMHSGSPPLPLPPPPPPPIPSSLFSGGSGSGGGSNTTVNTGQENTRHKLKSTSNQSLQPVSILKNSANNSKLPDVNCAPTGKTTANAAVSCNHHLGGLANAQSRPHLSEKLLDQYRQRKVPKQRLEIDILPSHLSCSKNKLLIASSYGKIRGIQKNLHA